MASEKICIFCGESPSFFQRDSIKIAGDSFTCCKTCYENLSGLDEIEICRESMRLGLVPDRTKVENYIEELIRKRREREEFVATAEAKRPRCPMCGAPLTFGYTQTLDASPMVDGFLSSTFDVLPMYCPKCRKIELFAPDLIEIDRHMAYLYNKDHA